MPGTEKKEEGGGALENVTAQAMGAVAYVSNSVRSLQISEYFSGMTIEAAKLMDMDAPWSLSPRQTLAQLHAAKMQYRREALVGVITLSAAQALLSPRRGRAFFRNVLLGGVPAGFVLFPEYAFSATLDMKRDALLDAATKALPPLAMLKVPRPN